MLYNYFYFKIKLNYFCINYRCFLICLSLLAFAKISWISFLLVICLITLLSYGIHCIKITIDPVDLWSSSNSQCRQEREYFNSNFKPFFRTTQVIIVPKGISDVNLLTIMYLILNLKINFVF